MSSQNDGQMIDQIQEYNFGYLNLAKQMIIQDKDTAMVRLGITHDAADAISRLSNSQILKICRSNQLLPRLGHVESALLETAITQDSGFIPHKVHSAILLTAQ